MMRRLLPRPARDVGMRGSVLMLLGVIWIGVGASIAVTGDPASCAQVVMLDRVPLAVRAPAWIATGCLAVAWAFRPRRIIKDGVGFAGLYLMPAYRAVAFLTSWVDSLIPVGGSGYRNGLPSGIIYLSIVVLIWRIARWPESQPSETIDGGTYSSGSPFTIALPPGQHYVRLSRDGSDWKYFRK